MTTSGGYATRSQQRPENGNGLHRKSLIEELERRGYRLTSQRRVLVEELENADQHLDATELLYRANQRDGSVNRATVYRTLDLLKKLGLVDELDLMHLHGEKHYYEVRSQQDHIHLACFGCGRIVEFTSSLYDELKREIQQSCGFSIQVVRLEVGGRCRECRAKTLAKAKLDKDEVKQKKVQKKR